MNDGARIRVLCVDDNPDLSLLLRRQIGLEADMECVGTAQELSGLMEEIARTRPHVVVLDLAGLGRDSLDILAELGERHPGVRAIIYSGFESDDVIARARTRGACGYVTKRDDTSTLLGAVRRVAAGEHVFP